jgi:Mg-chelatase subunit ChlD
MSGARTRRMVGAIALLAIWTVVGLGPPTRASAQADSDSLPVLLILDASGSMNQADGAGSTKIAAAKAALHQLITALPDGTQVGLRVFGARVSSNNKAAACQDTQLVLPVDTLDRAALGGAVDAYQAKGETPIGSSLLKAADDLGGKPGNVVLVSDGQDECFPKNGPDPCTVAKQLAAKGIDLKVNVVGFQTDSAANTQLQCIAAATGGGFVAASNSADLSTKLSQVGANATKAFKAGQPLPGGESVAEATEIPQAGIYTDAVSDGESKWWSIDVPQGFLLSATATLAPSGTGTDVSGSGRLQLSSQTDTDVQNSDAGGVNEDGATLQTSLLSSASSSGTQLIQLKMDPESPISQYAVQLHVTLGAVQVDKAAKVDGNHLHGGSSAVNAPSLGPGVYSDSLRPGQSKFYAYTVSGSGSVTASISVPKGYLSGRGNCELEITEVRRYINGDGHGYDCEQGVSIAAQTNLPDPASGQKSSSDILKVQFSGDAVGSGAIPFQLKLSGGRLPTTTTTAAPKSGSDGSASKSKPKSTAKSKSSDSGSGTIVVIVILAVLAALALAGGAFVCGRRGTATSGSSNTTPPPPPPTGPPTQPPVMPPTGPPTPPPGPPPPG